MTDDVLALIAIFGLLIAGLKLLRETLIGSLKRVHKEYEDRSLVALLVLGALGILLVLTACCLVHRFVSVVLSGSVGGAS
ncbi:hypothetical protein [Luteimonas sp. A482]